jgi:putative oxidoreductase
VDTHFDGPPAGHELHEFSAPQILADDEIGLQDEAVMGQRGAPAGVAVVGVEECSLSRARGRLEHLPGLRWRPRHRDRTCVDTAGGLNTNNNEEKKMNESIGKLILRVALGGAILLHGIAKLTGGIGFITDTVTKAGLPAFFAYGAYVGEVVAPLLLILGLYSRIGAGLIAINMLFAIGLVHRAEFFTLNETGGWTLELQGMFLFTAIALALMGPGRYSINDK